MNKFSSIPHTVKLKKSKMPPLHPLRPPRAKNQSMIKTPHHRPFIDHSYITTGVSTTNSNKIKDNRFRNRESLEASPTNSNYMLDNHFHMRHKSLNSVDSRSLKHRKIGFVNSNSNSSVHEHEVPAPDAISSRIQSNASTQYQNYQISEANNWNYK